MKPVLKEGWGGGKKKNLSLEEKIWSPDYRNFKCLF